MKTIQGINGSLELGEAGIMICRETAIKNKASLNSKDSHLIRWHELSEIRFKKANALLYGVIHFVRTNDPTRTFWQKLAVSSWNHENAVTFSTSQSALFEQVLEECQSRIE